jgi:hypothetical protein
MVGMVIPPPNPLMVAAVGGFLYDLRRTATLMYPFVIERDQERLRCDFWGDFGDA